jgi:DNA helicase-2/ATP-dependent DNA helicase PcrA
MAKNTSTLNLNKEQIDAVKFGKGPLLIIAGAGTGKTAVITERIKYLITKGLAKPEEILALTFTEKAAGEMEGRIDESMPLSYGDIWIMTFHSFCDQILRDNGLEIGLPSNFKLMTVPESVDLFKKNLFNFSLDYYRPLGNPNKFIEEILKHFSRLQDEVVTPDDYIKWTTRLRQGSGEAKEDEKLEIQKYKELATVYEEYNDLKLKEAKFDFGDLIIKTIELFKKRPNILKQVQDRFKYILVDEYQDTNYVQNELVNLLAARSKNITVVGDDNQSIYRFRGAAISNILQFKEKYKDLKIITLNKNYRSNQEILDGAYRLIKHNDPDTLEARLGISKKLMAVGKSVKNEIEFIHTNEGREEAEEVAKKILSLCVESNSSLRSRMTYEWRDFAILVRANNHADPFIRELTRQGIPNQFLGPAKLFEKEEIVDLISYLKILCDVHDDTSFYRVISSQISDISPIDLIKITSAAKKQSISIFDVVTGNDLKISVESKEKVSKILRILNKHLNLLAGSTAGEILYDYINEIGLYNKILENEEDNKAKNISFFFQKIKAYENENPRVKVQEVVDYIDLLTEVGESPMVSEGTWQDANTVNILTVHSAKGLEFPVVFLVNLVNERFPGRNMGDQIPVPVELIKEELPEGDFHLQEERRLFYVGMTRAKEKLFLTASDLYNDAKRKKKISPFVLEALGENTNIEIRNPKQVLNINFQKSKQADPEMNSGHKKVKIDYLSVSQIETFQTCPLHYKLKYIYKLPAKTSASASFGISIHNTLKDFYTRVKEGNKPSEKLIFDLYKNNWNEEGFDNKKHKQEYFKKGEKYLTRFLKEEFNPKIKTTLLEEKFVMPIDPSLKIGGKIDRVDDLGGGKFEIIDYKTGEKLPTQKDVDRDLQLSFYALALSAIKKIDPKNIKLSFYFLHTQEKMSTTRTKKDLEKVKEEILAIRDGIEDSDFKCNNNYFCQKGCEFSLFCKSD